MYVHDEIIQDLFRDNSGVNAEHLFVWMLFTPPTAIYNVSPSPDKCTYCKLLWMKRQNVNVNY